MLSEAQCRALRPLVGWFIEPSKYEGSTVPHMSMIAVLAECILAVADAKPEESNPRGRFRCPHGYEFFDEIDGVPGWTRPKDLRGFRNGEYAPCGCLLTTEGPMPQTATQTEDHVSADFNEVGRWESFARRWPSSGKRDEIRDGDYDEGVRARRFIDEDSLTYIFKLDNGAPVNVVADWAYIRGYLRRMEEERAHDPA